MMRVMNVDGGEYTGKEKEKKNKENKVMKQSAPQKSKTQHEKRQIKKQHTLIASHPKTIPNPNSPSSTPDS